MMRRFVARVIAPTLLVTVSLAGYTVSITGQSEDSTVAGCLKAGTQEGEFVLVADDKQTYQVQAAEGVELSPHANHRVELTGTIEKSETSAVMKAKALKMVAASCEG